MPRHAVGLPCEVNCRNFQRAEAAQIRSNSDRHHNPATAYPRPMSRNIHKTGLELVMAGLYDGIEEAAFKKIEGRPYEGTVETPQGGRQSCPCQSLPVLRVRCLDDTNVSGRA